MIQVLHLLTSWKIFGDASYAALQNKIWVSFFSFSRSAMSNYFEPNGLEQARLHHFTIFQRFFKLMSIESGIPSNHLILCCPLFLLPSIFPGIRVFSNESVLRIRWPKYWSFRFSISPSNEYSDWSPLGWTGWISLQSKGLSRVFSNTTVQKHEFFGAQFSFCPTLTSIYDYWKNHSFD